MPDSGGAWWEVFEAAAIQDELSSIFRTQQALIARLQDTVDKSRGPWLELRYRVFGGTGILFPVAEMIEMRRRIHRAFNSQGEYPASWAAEEKRWQRDFAKAHIEVPVELRQWKGVEI